MEESQTEKSMDPQEAGTAEGRKKPQRKKLWRRMPVILLGSIVLAGLFFVGLDYLGRTLTHESTDNAFLDGDIVSVAPKVSGQVSKVFVEQNQPVKEGDPLLEIDPRDYQVQLQQKESALDAARANEQVVKASFELLARQVEAAEATLKQMEAEAAADEAKAEQARADLQRAEDLSRRNIISAQEFDSAKAAATAAIATAKAGQEKSASERSKVAASQAQLQAGRRALERAEAQSKQSDVEVEQARLNLSYTRIAAPQNGRVTRKAVEAGDYVQVGQKLMALVLERLWVTANFKETQLTDIRVGQPVEIKIDSVDDRIFHGHIQSIQSGSGAAFSLLPPENAVGNFVKVVQRVPVRIFFDEPLNTGHVLGPGMSVVPSVHVTSYTVPNLLLLGVAVVLAAGAGILWARAARREPKES